MTVHEPKPAVIASRSKYEPGTMVATLLAAQVGAGAVAGSAVIRDAQVLGATGSTPNAPPGSSRNVLVLHASGVAVMVPLHAP